MSAMLIGIDIGGTNTKVAVVRRTGRVRSRLSVPTHPQDGPGDLFRRVATVLPDMVGRHDIVAAGVGCAGLIDVTRGRVVTSPNLPGWDDAPLRRIASRALGVPAAIDNDANAAAYGEYRCGSGRGSKLLVVITLGTGVGGGIVAGGHLIRGAANFAGEIGHMAINESGPRCHCGNRGCLEAYVGSYAIVREAKALLRSRRGGVLKRLIDAGARLEPKTIFAAARRRDAVALRVVNEAATHLGTALASIVNILNPDTIALGGGVAGGFSLMRSRICETVSTRAFVQAAGSVRIVRATLGNDAAVVGAALLAASDRTHDTRRG